MYIDEAYLKREKLFDLFKKAMQAPQFHLTLKTVQDIARSYAGLKEKYQRKAQELGNHISTFDAVHSTHTRIKSTASLIGKVLRKTIEGRSITPDNYKLEITDLIGIRALHVFKSDYVKVHEQIFSTFHSMLVENVHINLRIGDSEEIYQGVHDPVINRNQDYRSIHYLIKPFDDDDAKAEIQVRTIFEEGWSEINHTLLYKKEQSPHHLLLKNASLILSALSGDCDTLGELMRKIADFSTPGSSPSGRMPGASSMPPPGEDAGKTLVDIMEEYLTKK